LSRRSDIFYLLAGGNTAGQAAEKINKLYPDFSPATADYVNSLKYRFRDEFMEIRERYREIAIEQIGGQVQGVMQWLSKSLERLEVSEKPTISEISAGARVLRELHGLRTDMEMGKGNSMKPIEPKKIEAIENTMKKLIQVQEDGTSENASGCPTIDLNTDVSQSTDDSK